jgi:hypothetical protein
LNKKRILILAFVTFCLSISFVSAVELKGTTGGSLNALNSGYAITRVPWTDGSLLPGETANVMAYTTDLGAVAVHFRWNDPDGGHVVHIVPLTPSLDTWDGAPLLEAADSHDLLIIGDWGVQAIFVDGDGNPRGPLALPTIAIKAISWHVTPEVPIGTLLSVISMLGALGAYKLKKL